MLPVYLGLYMASGSTSSQPSWAPVRFARALLIGGAVTLGFVLLYGTTGAAFSAGMTSLADVFPWIGLGMGIAIILAGSWMLSGGKIYSALAAKMAARVGNPTQVNIPGYVLFGISFAAASLSCTLPIFMAIVATSASASGMASATGQFLMYAFGMGFIILVLTLGAAIFKENKIKVVRKALPFFQPVSAILMVLAGAYIVFYWLTIGDLL
jgi:cytochrome c biogenesis protein CcdA